MPPKPWSCLVVDDMHESFVPQLTEAGLTVTYLPEIGREEVSRAIGEAEVLVVRSKIFVDEDLLSRAPRLKLVARAGAGLDNLDETALAARGIAVINAPEGNRNAVGEHTVGMLLCLLRHLHTADREVRQKIWLREQNRGRELAQLTVGIMGYGNTGRSFARHLSGFGCRVLAYDKYRPVTDDRYAHACTLEELFDQTQVLSLHVPLTAETRGMVNQAFLEQFREPLVLLNTSRGEVVAQPDLVRLLKEGKVQGAALDVLQNEQLNSLTLQQESDFTYLAASENVLLSPHIAGWTVESYHLIGKVLSQKIIHFMQSA